MYLLIYTENMVRNLKQKEVIKGHGQLCNNTQKMNCDIVHTECDQNHVTTETPHHQS